MGTRRTKLEIKDIYDCTPVASSVNINVQKKMKADPVQKKMLESAATLFVIWHTFILGSVPSVKRVSFITIDMKHFLRQDYSKKQ